MGWFEIAKDVEVFKDGLGDSSLWIFNKNYFWEVFFCDIYFFYYKKLANSQQGAKKITKKNESGHFFIFGMELRGVASLILQLNVSFKFFEKKKLKQKKDA